MAAFVGYGNPPVTESVQDENQIPDQHEDSNITPSTTLLHSLRQKAYRDRLAEICMGLVSARRTYLNHADENWQTFLDRVQEAFEFFEEKSPERTYRDSFTIENYRMLFQRESSAYRDDVCRGVKRIRDGMWVNGEEVKFPQSLVDEGFDLAAKGEKLMDLVFNIDDMELHKADKMDTAHPTTRGQIVERFRQGLKSFDKYYVIFEKNYIEALIDVEKRSRSLVQTIAELIEQLAESGEKVNQELLDHMAELNKKSRDCYNCKYDISVMRTVLSKSYEKTIHKMLWYLPLELMEKFDDICSYLRDLLPKILRVHPKLEHNPGLVQRLEKFHEMYGRVGEWVNFENNPMSQFCYFLDSVLPKDCELDGSVDAILLIPRLFCLFAWKNRAPLLEETQNGSPRKDDEKDAVAEKYADKDAAHSHSMRPLTRLIQTMYPELLTDLSRILCGEKWENYSIEELAAEIVDKGVDSAEPSDLARAWENHSMQLQRHNATAWNAFVSVILHEDPDEEERRARPRMPSV
eukprot:CAMPEP_0178996540 /NCGR_PEP_ID=MMETSP0795-20121207/8420_1 /TAXON_ID=88552 /ORGANISM="Amoebophrya sp., Strain Ameob2" /LENGTH=519 /DNA_ID=CAMNT_0020688931 /DNA_START=505 /DNA_END=2064 /DNA_ORIENTATION=+